MLKFNFLLLRNVQKTLYNGLKVRNGFSNVRCIQTNRKASGSAISSAKIAVKGFIVIELGLFLGCYYLWKKMNRSQDFRYYMSKNYPTILDGSIFLNRKPFWYK